MSQELLGLRRAIETLKQFKRSKLLDETASKDLTKELYVDPRPGDASLNALKRPGHALLLGRKGTGKSTLFQRFQIDVREDGKCVSAYLDIKSLFSHAQFKSVQDAVGAGQGAANGNFALELCLWRSFIALAVNDIIKELPRPAAPKLGWFVFFKQLFSKSAGPTIGFHGLNDVHRYIDKIDIGRFQNIEGEQTADEEQVSAVGVAIDANVSALPSVRGSIRRGHVKTTQFHQLTRDDGVAMRQFRADRFIDDLRTALDAAGLQRLYLIIDDFSELPEEAMRLFAKCILEPFDNLANDRVCFKIAVYPGRIFLGNVDGNRFEVVHLDPHKLFNANTSFDRDGRAIDFVKRLVTNHTEHYCKLPPTAFFEDDAEQKIWEALYFASAANPRTLGHILFHLLENNLVNGEKISVPAIRRAAEANFHDRVDMAFKGQRFADEALVPRGTTNTHKELLERLVTRAQRLANREYRGGEPANFQTIRTLVGGKIPVSHFRVSAELEDFLASLEFNTFVTKYADVTDTVGAKFSVFTFNYGLCQVYRLPWYGTRVAERHNRFFMSDDFNFSPSVVGYYNESIEFVCEHCSKRQPGAAKETLLSYKMLCPHCQDGIMVERPTHLNFGPVPVIPKPELVLSEEEFELVALLGDRKKWLTARELSPELDESPQQVGVRAKALTNRGVLQVTKVSSRNTYKLTGQAQASYDKIKQQKSEVLQLETT